MNGRTGPPPRHQTQTTRTAASARRTLLAFGAALLLALAAGGPAPSTARAESLTTPANRALVAGSPAGAGAQASPANQESSGYAFTVGMLVAVDARRVTLRYEDGTTETFALDRETTIRSQNGDAESLADLEIGNMVLVITEEQDTTAVTIVNSGGREFQDAGPADIRGHDDPCGCASPEDGPAAPPAA